jgi:hypothetical protein
MEPKRSRAEVIESVEAACLLVEAVMYGNTINPYHTNGVGRVVILDRDDRRALESMLSKLQAYGYRVMKGEQDV